LRGLAKSVWVRHAENVMKTKIGIVILAAVCVGLLIALIATKKAADDQRKSDEDHILDFSNQLVTAHTSLDDLNQVNLMLTNDLDASRQSFVELSNNLDETSNTLTETKASLQGAQDQITNLNSRITDLEAQNKSLDDRATALASTIQTLDSQIAATQAQLATSETNNTFLTAELQKQMAQRAELEHKFNDIDQVRTQVKKLRDEAFVARRLQWMSNGTSPGTQPKGAQLLMQHTVTSTNTASQYDLNVEVGSDGSIHVIPPATNSLAH
jgi:chaperonin cofactor prefoldin